MDDDPDAAGTLAIILSLCGFDARACTNGSVALREFGGFAPHACVLDLQMPRMDGFELAGRLRVAARGRPLVLLTASGMAGPDVSARAADAGFDAVYVKPVDPQAVADLLTLLLDQAFAP